ncbi:hypothetical protein PC128_g9672 [Phytophthora cactorum]|nr:hypothetical protein PC128_g9672 [Phytophthora cactorum]
MDTQGLEAQAGELQAQTTVLDEQIATYYYHDSKHLVGDFSGYTYVKALEDTEIGESATATRLLSWLDTKYSSPYGGYRHFFRLSNSTNLLSVKSHADVITQLGLQAPFPPLKDDEKSRETYATLQSLLQARGYDGYRWKEQEIYINCAKLELKFVVINQARIHQDQREAAMQQKIDAVHK